MFWENSKTDHAFGGNQAAEEFREAEIFGRLEKQITRKLKLVLIGR